MRIRTKTAFRIRDVNALDDVDRFLPRLVSRHAAPDTKNLGELPANCDHGIERLAGVLEDHRDLLAANLQLQLGLTKVNQIAPIPADLTSNHTPWLLQKADDRVGGHRLARASLPDQPEHLSPLDLEA